MALLGLPWALLLLAVATGLVSVTARGLDLTHDASDITFFGTLIALVAVTVALTAWRGNVVLRTLALLVYGSILALAVLFFGAAAAFGVVGGPDSRGSVPIGVLAPLALGSLLCAAGVLAVLGLLIGQFTRRGLESQSSRHSAIT